MSFSPKFDSNWPTKPDKSFMITELGKCINFKKEDMSSPNEDKPIIFIHFLIWYHVSNISCINIVIHENFGVAITWVLLVGQSSNCGIHDKSYSYLRTHVITAERMRRDGGMASIHFDKLNADQTITEQIEKWGYKRA